jgi:hypothetical protein
MFAMDPFFGANPFIAPTLLPQAIEHLKQHMTLWYLNRMNGYVTNLRNGKPVDDYENPKLTAIIDKLYATVGQHVAMDSQQVFSQLLPMMQQLQQSLQANAKPAVLPPDAQVVKDTAMAETQRKAAKDKQDAEIAQAKIRDGQMRGQAEMQAAAQRDQQDAQLQLQIAQVNNQARIDIENAKLTHETIQSMAQPQLGAPNGNV